MQAQAPPFKDLIPHTKTATLSFWVPSSNQNMSLPLSIPASIPSQRVDHDVPRHTANFHPCIWGDNFLTYTPDDPVNYLFFFFKLISAVRIINLPLSTLI